MTEYFVNVNYNIDLCYYNVLKSSLMIYNSGAAISFHGSVLYPTKYQSLHVK